jgi:hypothetical protein
MIPQKVGKIKVENDSPNKSNRSPKNRKFKSIKCPECGVVFHHGKWKWDNKLYLDCQWRSCPACRKIKEQRPSGLLTLSGQTVQTKRSRVFRAIYKKIEQTKKHYPMNRLIKLDELPNGLKSLSFTDGQSPERIGRQLMKLFGGRLERKNAVTSDVSHLKWTG